MSDDARYWHEAYKALEGVVGAKMARITELEAQLAERWEPLPDDFAFTPTTERLPGYPTEFRITNQGRTLIFAEYDTEYELDLHDKAICRRVTQEPTHE